MLKMYGLWTLKFFVVIFQGFVFAKKKLMPQVPKIKNINISGDP